MINKTNFRFFKTSNVKPTGWLKTQLRIQADGLAGNLSKVWPDVRDSAWIGGDSEGWERVPYWLDGYIPLAYLLEDESMIAEAKRYMDCIISSQDEDGWICPCPPSERMGYDVWVVLLISKVLALYADCSGEEQRVIPVISKCLKQLDAMIDRGILRAWGSARWFEGLVAIYWLYERTGEEWLIDLGKKLEIFGMDWKKVFENDFIEKFISHWDLVSHVVNIAMVLRSDALMSRINGNNPSEFADKVCDYLKRRHSTAFGHFNGDENLSGSSPLHGTELCSVVEAMYSYEVLFSITGEAKWLDKLETLAFNALPATISPDMWTHQYVQMANQVQCTVVENTPFRTNGPDAHTFGLEPHFGCCTSNFGQGWPKFAMSAFAEGDGSIACCVNVPSKLETAVNNSDVAIECITDYPFRNKVVYVVEVSEAVEFELLIRIPARANSASVDGQTATPGEFFSIKRTWNGKTAIEVEFEFVTSFESRPSGMKALWYGPLVYTVAIDEKWDRVEYIKDGVERKFPYCDYSITPQSKWNYAFASDEFEICQSDFDMPFSPEKPPVMIKTLMAEIPWGFTDGRCHEMPDEYGKLTEREEVTLIPYGCSNLHMTELPDERGQF